MDTFPDESDPGRRYGRRMQAALLFSSLLAFGAAMAAPPNVLFICVDDLKPVLGCYGDAVAKTPNIDRLAGRGLRFDAAYCNQAVCSPSRNALMTSLRPQTLGIYELSTNFRKAAPDAVTVAQHFMAQGYRTEAMGKIFHRGHGNVEDAASWSVPHWNPKAETYALAESRANLREGRNGARGPATELAMVDDAFYADGLLAREAARRLETAAAKPDQPFFMAVGFIRPHLPFVAPKKYWDLYDPATLPMPQANEPPAGAPEYAGQFGGELRQYNDMPSQGDIDAAATRRLIHGYYAATSYMDAQVGLVLGALARHGLADNTIVMLWGDHGWHLGDHRFWCKHTNYEQATRIPLILAGPGVAAGASTRALVETVDLYPTLSELAGLPARAGLDGVSFAAVLKDPAKPARDSVIHVYPRNDKLGRAIRTERYRLVEWKKVGAPSDTAELELYDYQTDPLETRNLAAEQPEVVAQLRAILARHPEAKPQLPTGGADKAGKGGAKGKKSGAGKKAVAKKSAA
jgi:iduronate 2-sulfatase